MNDASAAAAPASEPRTPLGDLALLFGRLGVTAFGGPAAHIAMIESEVVRRRRWLSREEFLDYLGASQLMPGPSSTELAMHVGLARAGWWGLIVSGAAFILPAAVIVLVLAWVYVRYGALPETRGILYGVQPVVIALIAQALWQLGRTALKTPTLVILAALSIAAAALGVHEPIVLVAAGAVAAIAVSRAKRGGPSGRVAALATTGPALIGGAAVASAGVAAAGATATGASVSLGALFAVFLKIGSLLFGSGYVLIAFLRGDLVERLGWLTDRQLLDAVAAGQVTPGPVFTTATFVGYLVAGTAGAVVATIAIFLPAFVFVAASGSWVRRARRSVVASAFLDGVNAGALGLIAMTAIGLTRSAIVDAPAAALAVVAAILLALRVHSMWIVIGGALAGLVLHSSS